MPDQSESTGYLDRAGLRYLTRIFETDHPSDEPFVLTPGERKLLTWARSSVGVGSALLGGVVALAFLLPHHFWPTWFAATPIGYWDWPIVSILYGLLLIYLMVHGLQAFHAGAVRFMALVCQFPRYHDSDYLQNLDTVAALAQQRSFWTRALHRCPLIPHTIPGYLWVNSAKAAIITWLTYLALHRWGGIPGNNIWEGPVTPAVLLLGFFNGWASYRITEDALIRMLAPLTIRQFVNELIDEYGRDSALKTWIPAVFQRTDAGTELANYAHLMCVKMTASRFTIPTDTIFETPAADLTACPPRLRAGLERLLVFSILIDGRLSRREKTLIHRLNQSGWLKTSLPDIRKQRSNYLNGKGLWI